MPQNWVLFLMSPASALLRERGTNPPLPSVHILCFLSGGLLGNELWAFTVVFLSELSEEPIELEEKQGFPSNYSPNEQFHRLASGNCLTPATPGQGQAMQPGI